MARAPTISRGYTLHDESTGRYATGYFGPGELPTFDASFFKIPQGTRENAVLENFIEYLEGHRGEDMNKSEDDKELFDFRNRLRAIISGEAITDSTMF